MAATSTLPPDGLLAPPQDASRPARSSSAESAASAVSTATADDADDSNPTDSAFPEEKPPLPYRATIGLFSFCLDIFFREVRSRGTYKIPKTGPVIFVCAPHANQFIDPVMLMKNAGRQVGFLAAKKSMDKFWIGLFARNMGSIPVVRPQDLTKPGIGTIYVLPDKPTTILGRNTCFTKQAEPRSTVIVSGSSLEVVSVVSDTELTVKAAPGDTALAKLSAVDADGQPAGTSFKVTPHVNQGDMFDTVIARLKEGGCIGIFPEGGSHDRSDLLPLKPGVALMALGAMAQHADLNVKIVPCGLNYFHADKFRSRAVIEFGDPMEIAPELVEGYKKGGADKRAAVAKLLDLVLLGIKSVIVRAPDYDSLMVIQATRRLYKPPQRKLSIEKTLVLTKRFAEAFEQLKDEPSIQDLIQRVKQYNKLLAYYGIRDHQVKKTSYGRLHALRILLARLVRVIVLFGLAFPGALLHTPIVIICQRVGRMKAKEALAGSSVKIAGKDVVATWKMLAALVVAPTMYISYSLMVYVYLLLFTHYSSRARGLFTLLSLVVGPLVGYSAMRGSEEGIDVLKSIRPLFLAAWNPSSVAPLRAMRADLQARINAAIIKFGPVLYGDDFVASRVIRPEEADFGEVVASKLAKQKPVDDFNWEEVDPSEANLADDIFLFKNDATGAVKGSPGWTKDS
ncbi:hypothetical protein DFJ73DRAFT_828809 [Zopfochytrium polystomum]|nr:hypothetical protein DFJ73DRAFT_828809 [Zopfochytrium polystomum]